MSIQPAGIAQVQSRIAAIQARFETPVVASAASSSPTSATAALRSTTGTTSYTSNDFAVALAKLAKSTTTRTAKASAPSLSGVTGADVVAEARKYLGIPYVWGGSDPKKGFDCSGLVQYVYNDLGIKLPRGSIAQSGKGTEVSSLAEAKPGDLVTFGVPADHIGIYIGNNKMIVAPHTGDVVKVQTVYEKPSHIRRIIPDSTVSTTASIAATSTLATAGSSPAMAAAPAAYRTLFVQAGRRYQVSPDLLAGVAKIESGFNPSAVSPAGARGLMQIMPGTAKGLGVDPMKPAEAVDGAARLLAQHLRRFGSTKLALAAYNAGPGAVTKYHGVPPYAETRAYVTKVLAAAGRSS